MEFELHNSAMKAIVVLLLFWIVVKCLVTIAEMTLSHLAMHHIHVRCYIMSDPECIGICTK
jgi:hypothetical protein